MILTELAPLGGIESALVPLALELQVHDHQVFVYTLQAIVEPNQNASALQAGGIQLITLPRARYRLAHFLLAQRTLLLRLMSVTAAPVLLLAALADAARRRRPLGRSVSGAFGKWRGWLTSRMEFEALFFAPLAGAFRRQPPDVVHVHGWGCGEDPPGAMRWLSRQHCPLVYTEHNSPDPGLHRPVADAPMNLGDVLVAVSQAGQAGLLAVGQATRPILVIPYSVEPLPAPGPLPPRPNGFVITCVARLARQKGHTQLIEAVARLRSQIQGLRLLLAGDGAMRVELEGLVGRLGLEAEVEFLGVITRAQLPELMARSDVVALPSYWEGLPVALIEAMSAGKPIVASRVGGNPELVLAGETGLLVPPGDVDALAGALLHLANHPVERAAMGRAARQRFAQGGFSPTAVAAQHLGAYQLAAHNHIVARLPAAVA